ncbi:hypothetical protein ABE10_02505 [Bacillus toyonensis]|nr:hypothetical protein [Bacillus toyonensis]
MDERVLRVVGVLVLVYEDVAEAATIRVGDMGEGAEEKDRLTDEVVEVEGVGLLQRALVVGEHLDEDPLGGVGHVGLARVGLRVLQLVLEPGDA